VHLKSLTLRGFKSFADPTTLEFEPGVTVVVGPNGSGKSNVVDAVAWVLGAQGPRVVRSSKMDDVIFAGSGRRAALGRAEVSLTIDNSAKRLPVDLAEVTITRTLWRSGESEYSMNGVTCRLLDIQEMLSDAGVGRQQHVIMSQGQLATVLDARPEDRRAVIEEAAGVLKFRRRRERAERRLESTEGNLLRLQDLLREVRRQLRPLERQAEAARRHESLAVELHLLRLYVAGRELDSLQRRIAENEQRLGSLAQDDGRLKATLARLDLLVDEGEVALTAEQASNLPALLADAERLRERARGVANLVSERRRRVEAALAAAVEAGVVASLEAEAARLSDEIGEAGEAGVALEPERRELEEAFATLCAEETSAGRRADGTGPSLGSEALAGRAGELRRDRDRVFRQLSEAREARARAAERAVAVESQQTDLARRVFGLRESLAELATTLERARAELSRREAAESEAADLVTSSEAAAREAVEAAQSLHARAEALEEALDEASARAGVEQLAGHAGVLGTLLDVVEVEEGYEKAFEAAVEEALGAVVVDGWATARSALEQLRSRGGNGAVLPIGPEPAGGPSSPVTPDSLRRRARGTRPGAEVLLDRLLEGVTVCSGGLREALDATEKAPGGAVVVTLEGDRFSKRGWRLGAGRAGATRAALEAVEIEALSADRVASGARNAAEQARRSWAVARSEAAEASRAPAAAAAEERQVRRQLEEGEQRLSQVAAESEQARAALAGAAELTSRLEGELTERERALEVAEEAHRELRDVESEQAAAAAALAERRRDLTRRQSELEVRLAGVAERRSLLVARRDEVERRLEGLDAARVQAAEARQAFEVSATALERIGASVDALLAELELAVADLGERRRRHDAALAEMRANLAGHRLERVEAERELASTRERAQREELERTELRVRLETTAETVRHDLDTEPSEALAARCPELPPGTPAAARVRELERELRLLGPINPLALEELAGLEERDRFLTEQLEDVRRTRRELGRVIRAIDEEIVSVFTEAFADVSRHFEQLFETLFPGGSGRLSLLEPESPLTSGIEIEARPAGRNVRRLSLLSGGERSLVALAFLFAVFRSRPSPFYLMDEVEAALDDVNLHRFLDLVEEFRSEAQLVIVSHQKRTMESADIIYGVTMQPGGASKVVSERLSGRPAEAVASA
jgi:chromosome segregation protein